MKIHKMKQEFIELLPTDKNICLLGLQGSRGLGLKYEENADWDYNGIFILPNDELLSLSSHKDTIEQRISGEVDIVLHEVEKFFRLSIKCNPSILLLFFLNEYNIKDNIGGEIIANRDLFFSGKAVRNAFGGYALSQMLYLKRNRGDAKRRKKHVIHCFRLFDQGQELLETGKISLPIVDPEQYIELGDRWEDMDYVLKIFEERDNRFQKCKSILPEKPNLFLINKLLLKIRNV